VTDPPTGRLFAFSAFIVSADPHANGGSGSGWGAGGSSFARIAFSGSRGGANG
jgi:hypothetical protein